MIQANELRIGNMVGIEDTALNTDYQKEIFKEIFFKIEQLKENVAHVSGLYRGEYYKDLKPIPITEERLLKFGFERCEFLKNTWGNGNMIISLKYDIFYYELLNDTVELKYIHQLQNLFFALRCKELPYSDLV